MILKKIIYFLNEKPLFMTHTPRAFKVGDKYKGFVITAIRETTPQKLIITGDYAPCFEVYGVKDRG